jgi:hypothetical protein
LHQLDAEPLARQTGFQRRQPRKIWPLALLRALCLLLFQPRATLEGLAILLGLTQQQTLSKQAIAKRLTRACLLFIQEVLLVAIRSAATLSPILNTSVFSAFGRVLIQDSTCIGLPAHLARIYPGCRNQHRRDTSYAVLRLQTVYNLLTDQCLRFSCTPYTQNDQKASPDILELARPGDLVLRDLGYFVLGVFAQMQQQRVYFLSRLRHDVQVWTPKGVLREWAGLSLATAPLDETVWLGEDRRLQVRLIARPVPDSVAATRRRKLYRDCRNRKPSQERLALLHWDVFITNVPSTLWTTDQALGVYRARWRIEIIFKSWKSGFRLTQTLRGSALQVEACLYAQLLLITLAHHASALVRQTEPLASAPPLSILKYAQFWGSFGLLILAMTATDEFSTTFIAKLIQHHCRLDKRKKRNNYLQTLEALS